MVEITEAERMIEDYLDMHPGANWASEIAFILGLELDVTFEAVQRLLEEGRIEKATRKPPKGDRFSATNCLKVI